MLGGDNLEKLRGKVRAYFLSVHGLKFLQLCLVFRRERGGGSGRHVTVLWSIEILGRGNQPHGWEIPVLLPHPLNLIAPWCQVWENKTCPKGCGEGLGWSVPFSMIHWLGCCYNSPAGLSVYTVHMSGMWWWFRGCVIDNVCLFCMHDAHIVHTCILPAGYGWCAPPTSLSLFSPLSIFPWNYPPIRVC